MQLKIGDLARRAGLTVRTLHHYDAIELLSPSVRTPGGARLYGRSDLVQLHRIQALKQMGYSLTDIRIALKAQGLQTLEIIRRQADVLEAQARKAQALSETLKRMARHLDSGAEAQSSDWLDLLEMMTLYERHLTQDEIKALHQPKLRGAHQRAAKWQHLVAEVDTAMRQRMPLDSTQAHDLAWRWVRLVIAMTNNSAALAGKLKSLQEREPRAQEILGIGPAMFDWIGQAIAHARLALFAKHLSARQLAEVRRRQMATMAHMDQWPNLVALVREQMARGVACTEQPMQELARRWNRLFLDAYCGSDTVLEGRIRQAFASEPALRIGVGVDPALLRYIHAALLALATNDHS